MAGDLHGPQVGEHHVRGVGEPSQFPDRGVRHAVRQGGKHLAAVPAQAAGIAVLVRPVSAGPDDVRAEVGEQHACGTPGDSPGQLEHPDALERPGCGRWLCHDRRSSEN